MDVEPDAVAHPMAEVLSEAGLLDRAAAGSVHLARRRPGGRSGASRLLGGEHDLVDLAVLGARLAAVDRAAEVRAIAVDDAAEVEHHRGAGGDAAACGPRARVEVVVVEAREDVRGERRTARARGAQLVLDGLDEVEHRDAGNHKRCHPLHRPLDGRDRATHRLELLVRLHPAELVDDARPGAQAVEADDPAEVERRLRPDAVADRHARAQVARDALEGGKAVVGLRDDDHLARRLLAQVEEREHARQDEHRVLAGPEECAGHPAVGVGRLAEVRDVALDAGQVLEVGGRREEQRVDALGLEPLRQPAAALCVVEHRAKA